MSIILDDVHVHLPPKYSCIAVHMHKSAKVMDQTQKLLDKS